RGHPAPERARPPGAPERRRGGDPGVAAGHDAPARPPQADPGDGLRVMPGRANTAASSNVHQRRPLDHPLRHPVIVSSSSNPNGTPARAATPSPASAEPAVPAATGDGAPE